MRTQSLFLVFLLILPGVLAAQAEIPNNFVGMGIGLQYAGPRATQTSGWSEVCNRNPDLNVFGWMVPNFKCLATDYSPASTAARVDLDIVLVHSSRFGAGPKLGGGGAWNANGIGGAFMGGAWGTIDLSDVAKLPGLKLVASATWDKQNVTEAAKLTDMLAALRKIGAGTVLRFGFGKTW